MEVIEKYCPEGFDTEKFFEDKITTAKLISGKTTDGRPATSFDLLFGKDGLFLANGILFEADGIYYFDSALELGDVLYSFTLKTEEYVRRTGTHEDEEHEDDSGNEGEREEDSDDGLEDDILKLALCIHLLSTKGTPVESNVFSRLKPLPKI
jgi:hypothetical protein